MAKTEKPVHKTTETVSEPDTLGESAEAKAKRSVDEIRQRLLDKAEPIEKK